MRIQQLWCLKRFMVCTRRDQNVTSTVESEETTQEVFWQPVLLTAVNRSLGHTFDENKCLYPLVN